MVGVYLYFLEKGAKKPGSYNAGFENISILDIAKKVAENIPAEIEITESNDPRSYRVNSDKLLNTGFLPKRTIETAIQEMIPKFESGEIKDTLQSSTVEWMKKQNLHL